MPSCSLASIPPAGTIHGFSGCGTGSVAGRFSSRGRFHADSDYLPSKPESAAGPVLGGRRCPGFSDAYLAE
jgi:hypothetical protein